jgi:methylated-DNA-[protein]-cysteine S-methyltransferase
MPPRLSRVPYEALPAQLKSQAVVPSFSRERNPLGTTRAMDVCVFLRYDAKDRRIMHENRQYCGYYESPIGLIEVGSTATGVTSLSFVEQCRADCDSHPTLDEAIRQIAEYFEGTRHAFDLPLALQGTQFQREVWQQLLKVPFGQMVSYQEIANVIGRPRAARAVGAANGSNPISIIVPCHRVVGSDGSLTGYGGGLWRKEWLLRHEGCLLLSPQGGGIKQ